MKVLYLNHTGLMSGAERSLLELLAGLPEEISGTVACPEGPLANAARDQDAEVAAVPAAEASLRLRPVQTPLALADIVRSARAVGKLARRESIDLVHANSIRAGLVATIARRFGAPPVVVQVHDCLPSTKAADLTRRAINSRASVVVANSRYTAANFAGGEAGDVRTVYYGMVDDRGDLVSLNGPPDEAVTRPRLNLGEAGPLIGLVAQITPWKGQDTAIEALDRIRHEHPDAKLLLVGEAKFLGKGTRFDNSAYLADLQRLSDRLDLGDAVAFLGERRDALQIMAMLDVLVAPSWEEPFGRTIVEAIALGTPVIATARGGPAEIIEDRVSGRLVAPRSPEHLAEALLDLLGNPESRARMTKAAAQSVGRFSVEECVSGILSAYSDALSRGGRKSS